MYYPYQYQPQPALVFNQFPGVDQNDHLVLYQYGYIIEAKLGGGSFGQVYRIWHMTQNSWAAVKVARQAAVGNLYKEYMIINHLQLTPQQGLIHPNIIQFFGYIPQPALQTGYFLTEVSPIGDLQDRFKGQNAQGVEVWTPMDEIECRHIFKGVAQGLEYMHNMGVAHGDLKPANILLFWNPNRQQEPGAVFLPFDEMIAKICDFGGSMVRQPGDPPGKIMTTSVTCTLMFAAPESWYVRQPYDIIAADCFSFGVSILAMLLGAFPHKPYYGYNQFQGDLRFAPNPLDHYQRACIVCKSDIANTQSLCQDINPLHRQALLGLMDPTPNTRFNMEQYLSHGWNTTNYAADDSSVPIATEPLPQAPQRGRSGSYTPGEHSGPSIFLDRDPEEDIRYLFGDE